MNTNDWVLERVGPKKDKVMINKNWFKIGRMKDCDLCCPSLEVSREHCMITKTPEGLFLIDIGSSNGVYVNGIVIKPKEAFKLSLNAIIGIGCSITDKFEESLSSNNFVYRLKMQIIESAESTISSTNSEIDRQSVKQMSKLRIADINPTVKKPKIEMVNDPVEMDDDIEIIEPQFSVTENKVLSNHNIIPDIIDITDEQEDNKNNNTEIECKSIATEIDIKKEMIEEESSLEKINFDNRLIKEESCDDELNCPSENIKIEPDYSDFSQIDIVDLEDDDEKFPASQLMDKSIATNENENDNYNSFTFLDDDDQNEIIILESSDDEEVKDLDDLDLVPKQELMDVAEDPFNNMETVDELITTNPNQEFYLNKSTKIDIVATIDEKTKSLACENQNLLLNYNKSNILSEKDESTNKDSSKILENHSSTNDLLSTDRPNVLEKSSKILENHSFSDNDLLSMDEPNVNIDVPLKEKISNSARSVKDTSTMDETDLLTKAESHFIIKDALLKKTDKIKKKPIQIIEPHHIKPKKKSKNKDTDEKLKSKKKKRKSDTRQSEKKNKSRNDSSKVENNVESKDENKNIEQQEKNIENKNECGPMPKFSLSNEIESMRPRCKTTIVKVKVSQKSRNDMLCETMQRPVRPITKNNKKSNAELKKSENPKTHSLPVAVPRREVPSLSRDKNFISSSNQSNITNRTVFPTSLSSVSNSSMPTVPSSVSSTSTTINFYGSKPMEPEAVDPVEDMHPTVLSNSINNLNLSPYSEESNDRLSPPPAPTDIVFSEPVPLLKPAITIPSLLKSVQKKVSFKENISTTREFPIEEGNNLRNIRDGLSLRSSKKDFSWNKVMDLKIEDFLARVFAWEPVWLEQQQKVKTLPPIIKKEDMQQLPNTFKCFQDYYKRMETLLLLETWSYLLKEYECNGNRYNQSIALPCLVVRNSFKQMVTPNGLRYSTINVQCLVSKQQFNMQNPPVFGDIMILEYTIKPKENEKGKMRRAFAYVTAVHRQNAGRFLRSEHPLGQYVKNPEFLLTFHVQTRVIDEQTVQFEQIARLRSVLYLRSHLRLIQGLQYVPHSALRDLILKVNVDEFQLENVSTKQIFEFRDNLVTKEDLNDKQMEAVIKFTNASIRLEPKIGLLIGPPGTGKSKVIANLVTQILYGDGRFVNGHPIRILVCAPSNAAIDEIVLRLLDIRSAISKDHRFKMVRIGRVESMHEEVKKISVGELARREAQKTYAEYNTKSNEANEQMKYKMKRDIEALELLTLNQPKNKVYKKELENLRQKLRYISPKNPEQEEQEMNKLQNNAKAVLIKKANIIACTLSSCYTSQMENIFGGNATEKIATCIVDEATQCCEAETLIPLMLGVKSLILVGDPNQLPATVMSTDAKKLGLDRSLFTRTKEALEPQYNNERDDCKEPVITLTDQYRMVSAISYWPNNYFYKGKLTDRINNKLTFPFQPYRVLNLDGLQDDIKFSNTSEAAFVANLIYCLMTCSNLKNWGKPISVGIITPYQNQKSVILSTIRDQTKYVSKEIKNKFLTEVNTIDSFQGQERDVIILSCVRSSGIGFMSDQQRLCVALTRAKFSLFICGNLTTFQKDDMWQELVRDARSRGVVARLMTSAKPNEIKPHVIRSEFF